MKANVFLRISTAMGLLALAQTNSRAVTFQIANGDVTGLKSAITTANSNNQDDIIQLAVNGTYTLTASAGANTGLPSVAADNGHKLAIQGNGSTIQRSLAGGTPSFRILQTRSGADLTLDHLTIANGSLIGHGGAIYNNFDESSNAIVTISNCTIANNSGDYGGAIYNDGYGSSATLVITNSTFRGNFSQNNGGAIFNDGGGLGSASLTISGSVFYLNSNGHNGGGTIQHDGFSGSVTGSINASTFSQNSSAGDGGCIYVDGESDGSQGFASLNVTNCTFSNNSATSGSAIYVSNGSGGSATVNIGNSLFQSGSSGTNLENAGGLIASAGFNLSDDAAGGGAGTTPGGFLNHSGDIRNTDPLTDPAGVKDNGGPTATLALQAGSPAIDAGRRAIITASANDARREPRPYDNPDVPDAPGSDATDIGAYEADMRIVFDQKLLSDLYLNFMTILGKTYEIQGRTDPIAGTWTTVLGTTPAPPITGTGGVVQITIPGAVGLASRGYYRVHQLP